MYWFIAEHRAGGTCRDLGRLLHFLYRDAVSGTPEQSTARG